MRKKKTVDFFFFLIYLMGEQIENLNPFQVFMILTTWALMGLQLIADDSFIRDCYEEKT